MSDTTATWSISLDTECPECEHDFDLICVEGFREAGIDPIEHGTDRSKGVEVTCPGCFHEFTVDLEY